MRLLLSGYYGFNNLGDEAILASLLAGFKERAPKLKLVVLSKNPKSGQISRNNFISIFFNLLFSRGLISGGGGLLQDKTSRRSFLYYAGLILLAQLLRKKTFIIAQGIGPIRSRLNRMLLKRILGRAAAIAVRDSNSLNYLSVSLGIRNVVLSADPAIKLEPSDAKQIIKEENIDLSRRPLIGISLRHCSEWRALKPKIAQLVDLIYSKYKAQIIFLPFQFPHDIRIADEIIEMLKAPAQVIREPRTPEEVLGIIGQLDLVIGMRLHSLIFAVNANVPAYGISYDPKVSIFMEESSLPVVDPVDFSPEEAAAQIKELLDNKAGIIRSLEKVKSEMIENCAKNFDAVIS